MTSEQRLDRLERVAKLMVKAGLRARGQIREHDEKIVILIDEQIKSEAELASFTAETKAAFANLADSHAKTEAAFARFKANTEATFARFEANTEATFARFEANTEAAFARLAEAQAETKSALARLAESQAETERSLKAFIDNARGGPNNNTSN